jgi:poly-beta-hydroxyalkanoate depolymerase
MSSKTVLRPRITDLQSGDPKLQDLHRYALHLLQGQDSAQTAHNASLLFLTVVNAFQHAGITDLDWVPSLYIEVASREYEVSAEMTEFIEQVRSRGQNLRLYMGRKPALLVLAEYQMAYTDSMPLAHVLL